MHALLQANLCVQCLTTCLHWSAGVTLLVSAILALGGRENAMLISGGLGVLLLYLRLGFLLLYLRNCSGRGSCPLPPSACCSHFCWEWLPPPLHPQPRAERKAQRG